MSIQFFATSAIPESVSFISSDFVAELASEISCVPLMTVISSENLSLVFVSSPSFRVVKTVPCVSKADKIVEPCTVAAAEIAVPCASEVADKIAIRVSISAGKFQEAIAWDTPKDAVCVARLFWKIPSKVVDRF